MSKKINLKRLILLSASFSGELLREVEAVGGVIPHFMELRYGFTPPSYKKESYYSTVTRLIKKGDLNRKVDNRGNTYLEITNSGTESLKKDLPLYFESKWDGSFMVVTFDIPEKVRRVRDDLREKLVELGFGKLQESVWISPYHFEDELAKFLEENDYLKYVFVMKAKRILGKSVREKVGEVWHVSELNNKYIKLIEDAQNMISDRSEKLLRELWQRFFKIISDDPMLPPDLLPEDWMRDEAKKALEKITMIDKK